MHRLGPETLPPATFLWYMGLWGLSFTSCYTLVFTVPRWGALVAGPTARAGASWRWLAFLFGSHTLSNAAHNLAWCASRATARAWSRAVAIARARARAHHARRRRRRAAVSLSLLLRHSHV